MDHSKENNILTETFPVDSRRLTYVTNPQIYQTAKGTMDKEMTPEE